MNRVHYQFSNPDSFRSSQSTELARRLFSYCTADVRLALRDICGLQVEHYSDPIRMVHDGRKIGIGFFRTTDGTEISVSISPKMESLKLQPLMKALKIADILHAPVYFENYQGTISINETDRDQECFTPARVMALLGELASFSQNVNNELLVSNILQNRNKIRGRVQIERTLVQLLSGHMNFISNIKVPEGLRPYKIILLATAQHIEDTLLEWPLLDEYKGDIVNKVRLISRNLGLNESSSFSINMIFQLCRPPYPFGFKEILSQCRQYWCWLDRLTTNQDGHSYSSFRAMTIALDEMFETYVGHAWQRSLGQDVEWRAKPNYDYIIGAGNEATTGKLKPDHLFIDHDHKEILIVDAKYRIDKAASDQVEQLMAYLDYKYDEWPDYKKKGYIVYPGDTLHISEVQNFEHLLYTVDLPVVENLMLDDLAPTIRCN